MRRLLSPIRIGSVEIGNRLMHSATYEGMAGENGEVGDELVRRYRTLARGGLGLIIPGHMYVSRLGRAYRYQTGIHDDARIPGLERLIGAVHDQGVAIVLQLSHAGRQTTRRMIGTRPLGPSATGRDPVNLVRPRAMSAEDIAETIRAFGDAARRAAAAGADGVQIHAAHGYLLNQFLSPFFNRRKDRWGGTAEGRFALLEQVYSAVRDAIGPDRLVMVKLSSDDHTPREGITPSLAARYAEWLAGLGIDAIEISGGTVLYSFMSMCRGRVPAAELVAGLPFWKRPVGRVMMRRLVGRFGFDEPYHLDAATLIRPRIGEVPLAVVGGMRRALDMERLIAKGKADLISMSRPLLREPLLARRIIDSPETVAACESCNRCLAAAAADLPVRCYVKGLP